MCTGRESGEGPEGSSSSRGGGEEWEFEGEVCQEEVEGGAEVGRGVRVLEEGDEVPEVEEEEEDGGRGDRGGRGQEEEGSESKKLRGLYSGLLLRRKRTVCHASSLCSCHAYLLLLPLPLPSLSVRCLWSGFCV